MGFATQEQADAILAELRRSDAEREAAMPDTRAALHQASTARERLLKLGWADGTYCPKDGTEFALIQWGSTGIHAGHYMGEWPSGHVYSGDFLHHPSSMMWKAIHKLTPDEAEALERSRADDRAFMERQIRAFGGEDQA